MSLAKSRQPVNLRLRRKAGGRGFNNDYFISQDIVHTTLWDNFTAFVFLVKLRP
jgi:hypothetical protein